MKVMETCIEELPLLPFVSTTRFGWTGVEPTRVPLVRGRDFHLSQQSMLPNPLCHFEKRRKEDNVSENMWDVLKTGKKKGNSEKAIFENVHFLLKKKSSPCHFSVQLLHHQMSLSVVLNLHIVGI